MADLVTVAATIQAAQIQANYTLWASVVGAFGIGSAAWIAWRSGIKLHQHNNILEAKREVYLDVVASGQLFLSSMKRFPRVSVDYYDCFTLYYDDFLSKLIKVSVVCAVENRDSVRGVITDLELVYRMTDKLIYIYLNSSKKIIKCESKLEEKSKIHNNVLSSNQKLKLKCNRLKTAQINQPFVCAQPTREEILSEIEISNLSDEVNLGDGVLSNLNSQLREINEKISLEKSEQNDARVKIEYTMSTYFKNLELRFESLIELLRNELQIGEKL